MQNIKHYFGTHSDKNECFQTSNGFVFHDKHSADAHARELGDKTVTRFNRASLNAFLDGDEDELETGKSVAGGDVLDEGDFDDDEIISVGFIGNKSELTEEEYKKAIKKMQDAMDVLPKGSIVVFVDDNILAKIPEVTEAGCSYGDFAELGIFSIAKIGKPSVPVYNLTEYLESLKNEFANDPETEDINENGLNITVGANTNAQVQVGSAGATQIQVNESPATTEKPAKQKEKAPAKPKEVKKAESKSLDPETEPTGNTLQFE